MRFERLIGLIALTALVLSGLPAHVHAQTEWPNCENFRDQDDAQAAYDADRADPFDLESSEPINDVAFEDEPAFGTVQRLAASRPGPVKLYDLEGMDLAEVAEQLRLVGYVEGAAIGADLGPPLRGEAPIGAHHTVGALE